MERRTFQSDKGPHISPADLVGPFGPHPVEEVPGGVFEVERPFVFDGHDDDTPVGHLTSGK